MKIVTQEGVPVSETPEELAEEYSPEEDLRAIAQDFTKGFRKLKNSTILKIGAVVVALRIVNVAGAIIIENQRLKAKQKQQDEEQGDK